MLLGHGGTTDKRADYVMHVSQLLANTAVPNFEYTGSVDFVNVAVLNNTDASGLTLGSVAEAHGNHSVASTWWDVVTGDGGSAETASAVDPIVVYDALRTDQAIVYATLEGLSIAWPETGDSRVDLIASRALRFVTG